MVIKVGKEFLKRMYRCVLNDLSVAKKNVGWYVEQFEDCYITEDGEFKLGDGEKSYFVEGLEEAMSDGFDEFEIEVVEGREIVLALDSGDEDGEELEDSFYDFVYEAMERFGEDFGSISEE